MSRVCENLDGSLKGGAKVSQRLFVQMLGLRCAKFLHDSVCDGATPDECALGGGFLARIQAPEP